MQRRLCPRCGLTEAMTEFGNATYCVRCNRARVREWRAANPEKHRVAQDRYKVRNRTKIRAANRKYAARRQLEDPETVRRNRRNFRKSPKGVLENRLALHRHRGAKTDKDAAAILYRDPCSYCGRRPVEIDHIVPLASGGDGTWENLTTACRPCNAAKNDRSLLRFLVERMAI